jgi:drug/metabolite transporter (DMT)-like permease
MFFLLDTMLTPIWIWMIFGELPTPVSLVGGSIVIVTLISHSLWRFRSSGPSTAIELSPN